MYRRTKLTITTFALLCLAVTLVVDSASAQTAKELVGTWTNVSNINIGQDGKRIDSFGPRGTGIAIFESNGRYALINLNPDTPKFVSNNRGQGTAAENKAAIEGGIAHYGTYTYDAANKVINFKIEGSTYPNWTGTEQKRTIISFVGDDLKWSVAASIGGMGEVGWKRAK
jgi:hypothetical protein